MADLFDPVEPPIHMPILHRLIRFARKSPREQLRAVRAKACYHLLVRGWKIPHAGNDRTAYVIGLFGTGRSYINELLVHNIGERANYFRDYICFHPGPTSMIYSGHATMKYVSRLQDSPTQTSRILEAVRLGFADLIFVYRHPLDSLLTNWIWWRTYLRDNSMIKGISQGYKNTDDLSADLEQNFLEFKAFAKATLSFSQPRQARHFCLSRNLLRKLSFISSPPRSRCGLRTS